MAWFGPECVLLAQKMAPISKWKRLLVILDICHYDTIGMVTKIIKYNNEVEMQDVQAAKF